MPYDLTLAQRISKILGTRPNLIEKKMFGGIGYILRGNMACSVQWNDLIVRVGVDQNAYALSQPFVRPFMVTGGKPMAGWVLVGPEALGSDQDLEDWVERGYAYALTLSEKKYT